MHQRIAIFLLASIAAAFCGFDVLVAAEYPPPRRVDVRRAAAAGVRVLDGRYVRLVTDLPTSAAVDELPAVFDAAVPQWAAYFDLPASTTPRAKWLAFLIDDRERFAALGLLPADNPNFVNGYARGWELWLEEQPSDYYRRHLLLHEGTHAFMQTQLGGCGAPWYMEGVAELLGTHTWRDGNITLGVMPASKEAVPMWGRIKIIRDAVVEGKAWPLEAVLAVDNSRVLTTEHYAWTWALAAMLDGHPQFRARFRALNSHVNDVAFNERLRNQFAEAWADLLVEWEAYIAQLDYGYDMSRMALVHRKLEVVTAPRSVKVAADRGWQSTGWLMYGGEEYRVAASGRFQIANDGQPWSSEAGGVTIEYRNGRPLGALLAAIVPAERTDGAESPFTRPMLIGVGATVQPKRDSILFVRVNDSPAKLSDNAGELTLRLTPTPRQLAPGQ